MYYFTSNTITVITNTFVSDERNSPCITYPTIHYTTVHLFYLKIVYLRKLSSLAELETMTCTSTEPPRLVCAHVHHTRGVAKTPQLKGRLNEQL